MIEQITNNWKLIAVGFLALWMFSAAVGAMQAPTEASSARYRFLYGFVHTLAGNVDPLIKKIGAAFNRLLSKKLDNVAPEEKKAEEKKDA